MKKSAFPYSLLSAVLATAAIPAVFVRAATNRAFSRSLRERLGGGGWRTVEPGVREIWLHGASVGEVQGIIPVAQELKSRGYRLFLTTTSETGLQAVRNKKLAGASCFLPLDHPWLIRRAIRAVKPRVVVIFETELWPNLLFTLAAEQIPVVMVNARISDRTVHRYLRFRSFFAAALQGVEAVLAQSELDRERFLALGLPAERISVNGSTKFDVQPKGHAAEFSAAEPCFVAGSVRPGEEECVIDAYLEARRAVPNLRFVLAPRHLDRVGELERLLHERSLPFSRRSQNTAPAQVLLLDTLGELQTAYASATVAFVGGTLAPIGGHNPLEPAAEGVPVLIGPHTENVRGPVQALLERGGAEVVTDSTSLAQSVTSFCLDARKRAAFQRGAKEAWHSQRGATDRVVQVILGALQRGLGEERERKQTHR